MSAGLVVGIILAGLGIVMVSSWWLMVTKQKVPAKFKKVPAAVETKDWQAIAVRLELRIKSLEEEARGLEAQVREKDKQVAAMLEVEAGLRQQIEQGKAWIEKETSDAGKIKVRERELRDELDTTRKSLNAEVSGRIKLETEVKALRQVKDGLSETGRGLVARVAELERRLGTALHELNHLRTENSQLRKKDEGTEWVSKADYKQLEAQLKKARQSDASANV